ncbi:MAG TPA: hypothetical protein VGQ80_01085, partial [Acidimicrobiia bacterium]|nr:hypothetical protein [Acidimicrobiia bacterium]
MGERDVHTEAQVKPANVVRLREQISNLHSLFVLSMMMTESRDEDEILSLAVTSVSSLGPCTTEGAYRPAVDPGGSGGSGGPVAPGVAGAPVGEVERFRDPPGRRPPASPNGRRGCAGRRPGPRRRPGRRPGRRRGPGPPRPPSPPSAG